MNYLPPIRLIKGMLLSLTFIFLINMLGCSYAPTDVQLVERFKTNREAMVDLCNRLEREPPQIVGITTERVMIGDPSTRISPEKAGFSPEHFLEYKALLYKAHVSEIWRANHETCFYITGAGFAGEGWRLCYVYTRDVPSNLIARIDRKEEGFVERPTAFYRALGDNWYIKLILLM